MAIIFKSIIRSIEKSNKARMRELKIQRVAYERALKEEERLERARIKQELRAEKQASKEKQQEMKNIFDSMVVNSKNMLAIREARRKEILAGFINNNFK